MPSKKKIVLGSLLLLFSLSLVSAASPAFTDHATVNVSAPQGTSVPGCEVTNECFVPYEVTIDIGGEVT